jgi:hypothetical protein
MLSKNPNQQRHNQPYVEWRSHWTTIHLRSLRSQSISHKNWLAWSHHLDMLGSCQPKEVTKTALAGSQSHQNWLSKMRNSRIWSPYPLHLWSQTIMRMALTNDSVTEPQPCLRSARTGIRRWMKSLMQLVSVKCSEISLSFRKGEKLCQVTGYTRSSVLEQAMCSGSRPGWSVEEITKSKAWTTKLHMHRMFVWATLGLRSPSPPSMISWSIK